MRIEVNNACQHLDFKKKASFMPLFQICYRKQQIFLLANEISIKAISQLPLLL